MNNTKISTKKLAVKLIVSMAVIALAVIPIILLIHTGYATIKLDVISVFVALLLAISIIAVIFSVFGIDLKVTSKETDNKISQIVDWNGLSKKAWWLLFVFSIIWTIYSFWGRQNGA